MVDSWCRPDALELQPDVRHHSRMMLHTPSVKHVSRTWSEPSLRRPASMLGFPLMVSLVLVGCDTSPPATSLPAPPLTSCSSKPASRWAVRGPARDSVLIGGGLTTAGLAVDGDWIFVFDRYQANVSRFSLTDNVREDFGRVGQGPGELTAMDRGWAFESGWNTSWIDARRDTVVLFDGAKVLILSPDGGFRGQLDDLAESISGVSFVRRVRWIDGEAVVDIESRGGREPTNERQMRIWAFSEEESRQLHSLTLTPLPKDARGARFQGMREAVPSWDTGNGCVAITDGGSSWVLGGSLGSPSLDTLRFDLGERQLTADYSEAELLAESGATQSRLPEPAMPMRVRDLVIDPDGWVWLWPIQPAPKIFTGEEVIRISLETHRVEWDTVPGFPRAFGPPGSFYVTRAEGNGAATLLRLEF